MDFSDFNNKVYQFYVAIVEACTDKRIQEGWENTTEIILAMNDALLTLLLLGWRAVGIDRDTADELMDEAFEKQKELLDEKEEETEEDQALTALIDDIVSEKDSN